MKTLFAFILLVTTAISLSAQTCVGTFELKLIDEKNKKPLTDKLEKNIAYVFTTPEDEFYNNVEAVIPFDSIQKNKRDHKIYENTKGYQFIENPKDASLLMFPTHCGLYLVHTELIRKKDTMELNFFNIPAHLSFQIDSLPFKKGAYFFDLQATQLFDDFKWNDRGFYMIPASFVTSLATREED